MFSCRTGSPKCCLPQNESLFLSHVVSVPPYKSQVKKITFIPSQVLSFLTKQEILDCFAHTPESVLGQIQRELKISENFLSVYEPGKDQKVCQCSPKQPGIAGRETRGWSCGVLGNIFPAFGSGRCCHVLSLIQCPDLF